MSTSRLIQPVLIAENDMRWMLERLQEPSTWRGLVWLLTAAGVAVSPDLAEKIAVAGMAVAGLLGVVLKERGNKVEIVLPTIGRADRHEPAANATDAGVDRV